VLDTRMFAKESGKSGLFNLYIVERQFYFLSKNFQFDVIPKVLAKP